jgi:hypothetical protein
MASSLPPPDGTVRWEKWRSRFQRDAQGNLPQGSSVQMERVLANPSSVARIKASFDGIYAAETEVRQILNAAGVSTIQYPYYLAFGREMWKLTNRISGESAAKGAGALMAKWEVRGLSETLLAQVCYDVFGVSAPAGP